MIKTLGLKRDFLSTTGTATSVRHAEILEHSLKVRAQGCHSHTCRPKVLAHMMFDKDQKGFNFFNFIFSTFFFIFFPAVADLRIQMLILGLGLASPHISGLLPL